MRGLLKNSPRGLCLLLLVGPILRAWPQDQSPADSVQQWSKDCQSVAELSTAPSSKKLRLLSGPGPTETDPHSGHYYKVGKAIAAAVRAKKRGTTDLEI